MKEISLAIPFYNSSQYFLDAVRHALENPFVKEIIISDDHSNEYHCNTLMSIVRDLKSDKIRIIRTDKNLGGFKNKYFVVSKSTCEWVYLLDSDNFMMDDTLDVIKNIDDPDPNVCYCPQKIILCQNPDKIQDEISFLYEYEYIGSEEAKNILIKNLKYFDWFLNTGNYVFNRKSYLDALNQPFNDNEQTFAGDVIAASYFWFKSGRKLKSHPKFYYYHRLRNDSYWHSCGVNSSLSVENYKSKILNLI
jgi:GT2 family glycosyltransferase